jgi:hypothetical protein
MKHVVYTAPSCWLQRLVVSTNLKTKEEEQKQGFIDSLYCATSLGCTINVTPNLVNLFVNSACYLDLQFGSYIMP